ncbi:MAG: amidase [Devosia sp.]
MTDHFDDIASLAADLASGRTTSRALTEASLGRIAERDGAIKAFVATDPEGALAAADASDHRRRAGGALGPLDGIPLAVKDNLACMGMPTTGGHSAKGLAADRTDAGTIARLRAAGAVMIGKVNLHEGALGATTDNPHHGRTINPLMDGATPGGSSGGSAAAVAAGMVPATLGTDTMGSVRIPAAYCGLYGLKPTAGRVGRSGLSYLSPTLDTIGPITSSATDLATLLAVIEGADPCDPDSEMAPALPPFGASLTFGVVDISACEVETAVLDAMEQAREALARAGVSLVPVAIEGWDPPRDRRAGLLVSEAELAVTMAEAVRATPERFGEAFADFVRYGESVTAIRLARAYNRVRQRGVAVRRALAGVDALLLPTAPQRAFLHGAPVPANQADLTAIANFAGLPAVAIPIPAQDGGLPASLQLVGRPHTDAALAELACRLTPIMAE